MSKIFIILSILIQLSTQQDLNSTEQSLKNATNDLIKYEQTLVKSLTVLNAYVKASSSNLKSVNITQNLSTLLDSCIFTISRLNTINNYQNFLPIENYSFCDMANVRSSLNDLDVKKFRFVISDVEANVTKIYSNFISITFDYSVNIRRLSMNWTRERSVVNVFTQTMKTFDVYFKYIGLLRNNLKYYESLQTYLSDASSNCPLTNSSFADNGNKIEDTLIQCQEELINSENLLAQKIEAVLLVVAATAPETSKLPVFNGITLQTTKATTSPILKAASTPSNKKITLDKLKNNLKKFTTTNNYKKVSWPRIPDSSGSASSKTLKLRAAQEKKTSYSRSYDSHFKNRTYLQSDKNDLKSTNLARRKRATDPVIDEILNLTSIVENQFTTCMGLINGSLDQVDQIIKDTILQQPCGTFVPYDPVNNINAPQLYGFQGGVHYKDGVTKEYVGYGGPCKAENPVPGYIDISPAKPGCFMECVNELYDNTNLSYLLSHPDLAYVPTDITSMTSIPGAILLNGTFPFYFGRVKYLGTYQLGKAHLNLTETGLYITGSNNFYKKFTSGYEVLACSNNAQQPAKVCAYIFNATNSGSILKKGCVITSVSLDFPSADLFCKSNGMSGLYAIRNLVEFVALRSSMGSFSGANTTGPTYHINGQQSTNGTWFNTDGSPFYCGAIPANGTGGFLNIEALSNGSWSTIAKNSSLSNNFVCEFGAVSQPASAICSNVYNIKDPKGLTIKKACIVSCNMDFPSADAYCKANGLAGLFAIRNNIDRVGVILFMQSNYGASSPWILHIDGQQTANGSWFNSFTNQGPLFAGSYPVSGSGGFLNIQGFYASGYATSAEIGTASRYFICEFDVIKTNFTVCDNVFNITDTKGLIIKKACQINANLDFSSSDAYCKSFGMSGLFMIRNQIEKNVLITFMTSLFGANVTGPVLHIGGQQIANGSWFLSDGMPLFSGAIPATGTGGFLNIVALGASGWSTVAYSSSYTNYFICEFDVLKTPITSVCSSTTNITDSTGSVVKKACWISTSINHSQAVDYCRSYGMKGLYAISTLDQFNGIVNYLITRGKIILSTFAGARIQVDGVKDANGTWFNYNPNASLMYPGAIPQTGTGDVMTMIGTANYTFVSMAIASNQTGWFVCEYDVV